jgi:4-amino-4-deoxy-L-arabinose transferase-like glycosyltransferase
MGDHSTISRGGASRDASGSAYFGLIVVAVAALVFLGCIISPPSLMDDVDAVQAQISRNMLDSGDWVTARLDGIAYLEKSPLKYWMIAVAFKVLGVHDWVARLPVALSAVVLCWLACRMGAWAFSRRAGMYAGLVLATCVGLFLFTRIQIPDVTITATIALALWAFLRTLDEKEARPALWSAVMAAAIGTGLLLKGLIAMLFPVAAAVLFLAFTGEWRSRESWKRLHVFRGILIVLAIAAPWHILATLRNPPYFDFSMHSGPGEYRGFFWFYFFNEHLLRFLNLRYPRDYNTVPRLYFWLFHLLWLFPWSVYLPAVARLNFRARDRAGRMRLLCLCWAGFLLVFFTFSSTQEYYSMPCYPALALLIASALTDADAAEWVAWGRRTLAVIAALAFAAIVFILSQVWNLPAPGDISRALTQHPELYTLSLGHMGDLTLASFAYLRTPLLLAGSRPGAENFWASWS